MQIITRPITMLMFEPIITFTAIYISVAYSLVFFYFQAYPIIFQSRHSDTSLLDYITNVQFTGVYGFTIEQTSLTYIPGMFYLLQSLRAQLTRQ